MNISALIIAATLTFSPFAGLIAFIITYDEYLRHIGKKRAMRQALFMAFFSFIIFVFVGILSGVIMSTFISPA